MTGRIVPRYLTLTVILALIMFGVALELKVSDFKRVLIEPRAGIVGLSAVLLFMLIRYRLPGLLADSLPDDYGNALIDAWLAREGRDGRRCETDHRQ